MFDKLKKTNEKKEEEKKISSSNSQENFDINSLLGEEKEEKEKIKEKIREEAKKKATQEVKSKKKKETLQMLKDNKYLLSNLFLIVALIFSYVLINDHLIPSLKKIEVLKKDIKLVKKDNEVVKQNLELLSKEKDKALEYRRLNYFLDQAVPITDKYEDNLVVILNILNESITDFSKNKRYLSSLNLKPNTRLRDVEVFNTENQRILAISYNISVEGFYRYKDVKDFINLIEGRVKIFHISRMSIAKTYDQKTKKVKYKLSFQMYSYYRVPALDDFGNPIQLIKEASFD